MLTRLLAAVAVSLCLAHPAPAQERQRVEDPPECHWPADQPDNWQACVDAATIGSPAYVLANMNLGTEAFLNNDLETAQAFYDQTYAEGQEFLGDPFFHAYRCATYEHFGRYDEALADALRTLQYLRDGVADIDNTPLNDDGRTVLYLAIIETLHRAAVPELAEAIDGYTALPVEGWEDALNRAVVLTDIGSLDEAELFSEQALAAQPGHPIILNNHCYLLALMGDGEEAIPYCERALALVPEDSGYFAGFLDSLAAAQEAAGRCDEAQATRERAVALAPGVPDYAKPTACKAQ